MSQGRILVVEDDPRMQRLLRSQLGARGYEVVVAGDGEAALDAVADAEPTVVLLDISLPGISGLDVCRGLREWSSVPILLLTAHDAAEIKIEALEMGADDYLTKPFHLGELIARIRALQRRSALGAEPTPPVLVVRGLTVDLARREVHRTGEAVHLTRTEFELLRMLMTHPERVLTYEYLLEAVWGPGNADVRPVHVHLSNLRRKLSPSPTDPRYILSVPGVGYRFCLDI